MENGWSMHCVERVAGLKFDGVKFMFRIDIDDQRSGNTMKYCIYFIILSQKLTI